MPLAKAHPTDLSETLAEVERLLARTADIVVRSTARLRQAGAASRQANRDNVQHCKQIDAVRQALNVVRRP